MLDGDGPLSDEDRDAVEVIVAGARQLVADLRGSAPPVLVQVADAVTGKYRAEKRRREFTIRMLADEAGVERVSQVSCLLNLADDRVTVATLIRLARWAGLRLEAAADA